MTTSEQHIPNAAQWVVDGLYRALEATDAMLEALAVRYTMIGGTLLGAVRHGGMIPWDDDGDLGVLEEDRETIIGGAEELLRPRGFGFFDGGESHMKVFALEGDPFVSPFVDVFPMAEVDGRLTYSVEHERRSWPDEFLARGAFDDLRRLPFGPLRLSSISEAATRAYLDSAFGPSWPTEFVYHGMHTQGAVAQTKTATCDPALPSWRALSSVDARRRSLARPIRAKDLEVTEIKSGLLIFDGGRQEVQYLNPTSAYIYELADGNSTVEDIAAAIQTAFGLDAPPFDEVAAGVDELWRLDVLR